MSAVLDIHLFPLHIKDSIEQAYLPGLHFMVSPKNAMRSRLGDQIILLAASQGEMVISSDRLTTILDKAGQEYYRTSGTVTAGLKRCMESINDALLDYNLKESAGSQQQSCMVNLAVIREDRVYIAHSGYTHSFVLNKEQTQHFFDPESSGRGLGLSRTLSVRFFLAEIKPDEYILFSPEPLATWTPSNLAGSPSIALDYLRRRLLNQVSPNIRALLVQAVEGSGKSILEAPLSSKSAFFANPASSTSSPALPNQTTHEGRSIPTMAVPSNIQPTYPTQPKPSVMDGVSPVAGQMKQIQQHVPISSSELDEDAEPGFVDGLKGIASEIKLTGQKTSASFTRFFQRFKKKDHLGDEFEVSTPSKIRMPNVHINTEPLKNSFVKFEKGASSAASMTGKTIQKTASAMGDAMGGAVDYITPEGGFKFPQLSNSVMILIAVIIPLLVAATGSSIYFNKGRSSQFTTYYAQAEAAAAQANGLKEPREIRKAWENALTLLDQAEKYGKNSKSTTLRKQAQDVLDDVEGVGRLEFSLAIQDGLPGGVKISRMKATSTDLYMLDETDGKIMRALLTGRGFDLDSSFTCAPGAYGSYVVDPLIDFALMPKGNSLGASIAALDGKGNIVYCSSGSSATSMTLLPPETGWGKIEAIAIDSGRLFVLDTPSNAIWVYGGVSGTFTESPELLFDNDIPPMADVIDFSINRNDLYMLHQDGHLSTCVFSTIGTPTKCKDPAPFTIERPGVEKKPVIIPDSNFVQLQYSDPPDPSIYLLDTNSVSIYHFSLKLSLVKQLSVQAGDPLQLLKRRPTAFAVSPAKVVFMAFDDKIYNGIEP